MHLGRSSPGVLEHVHTHAHACTHRLGPGSRGERSQSWAVVPRGRGRPCWAGKGQPVPGASLPGPPLIPPRTPVELFLMSPPPRLSRLHPVHPPRAGWTLQAGHPVSLGHPRWHHPGESGPLAYLDSPSQTSAAGWPGRHHGLWGVGCTSSPWPLSEAKQGPPPPERLWETSRQ